VIGSGLFWPLLVGGPADGKPVVEDLWSVSGARVRVQIKPQTRGYYFSDETSANAAFTRTDAEYRRRVLNMKGSSIELLAWISVELSDLAGDVALWEQLLLKGVAGVEAGA
jgi:hypothetical protein